jgi:hypothetical protein
MKLQELVAEAPVIRTTRPGVRRFYIESPTPLTFSDVKNHPNVLKYAGPNTYIFDATNEERVKLAPGENKWNAMTRLFGHDSDEIACANSHDGKWWLCLAINIET